MKIFKDLKLSLLPILFVLGYGLLISAFSRFIFWSNFASEQLHTEDIIISFLHGIRFDLSALIYLNIIFFCLLAFKVVRTSQFFYLIWALIFTIYSLVLGSHIIYFSLYGTGLNLSFIKAALGGATLGMIFLVLTPHWPEIILGFILFFIHLFVIKKIIRNSSYLPKKTFVPVYILILLVLAFLGIRGGLQSRVLGIPHTWIYANGNSFLALLTSNPMHSLLRSNKNKLNIPSRFLNGSKKMNFDRNFGKKPIEKVPKNVLIIFVESISSHAYENDFLPNLKNWSLENKDDLVASTNFYSNGILSKDAVVSMLYGIPSYFDIHYFESEFVNNNVYGFGNWTEKLGLENFFLHGAIYGTQHFDVIVKASKIENYISVVDTFDGDESLKSRMGVHDKYLYDYSLKYLDNINKPFAGIIFTTSSHTPYVGTPNNPLGSGNRIKDYELSVNYTDIQLVNFLEEASKHDWFSDTLIIITGDHLPPVSTEWTRNAKEFSRVPFLMYMKGSNFNRSNVRLIGRHIDVPPTIFHLMGVPPDQWTPYGRSLFETSCVENEVCSDNTFFTKGDDIFYIDKLGQQFIKPIYNNGGIKNNNPIEFDKIEVELKDYVYRLKNNDLYGDQ